MTESAEPQVKTVVFYHGPGCADGFGAAFAAWAKFHDDATYVPVNYGAPPPGFTEGCDLYILDFSYPRGVLLHLLSLCRTVTVIDHHATARADLEEWGAGIPGLRVVFDMKKSGAVLAWEHFHPDEPVPELLRLVQDRDLWEWNLWGSRAINAALAVEDRDFVRWDALKRMFERGEWQPLFDRGEAILAAQARDVARACDHAYLETVGIYGVPAVNSPLLQSEIGEELCRRHPAAPFALVWFALDAETEVCSLRSRGGFDVSAVAKSLGGGGHPAAAGFRRSRRLGRLRHDEPG